MEFSEIQISITAVFLLMAVALVVLCNVLRNRKDLQRETAEIGMDPAWETLEPSADPASLAPEIAALAAAGMREKNSDWGRFGELSDFGVPAQAESAKAGSAKVEGGGKALQLPPPTVDEWLFDLLVSGRSMDSPGDEIDSEQASLLALETRFEVIQRPSQTASPRGMIDEATLDKVLHLSKPFSGVVVSICINDEESGPYGAGLLEWVSGFIAGLLRENDFACRTGAEEFLILCPGVHGAEAQRRLNEISEGLWEFQLRGIGTYSILFSWGGVRVQNQALADAIASASERMRLTKRGRNLIYSDSVHQRRRVV